MNKEEIYMLISEYGISEEIILKMKALIESNEKVKEKDIFQILELVCFDYMHLEVSANIDIISDGSIEEEIDAETAKEIIEDKYDRLNDLIIDLETLTNEIVELFYDNDSKYKNVYIA